MDRPHSQRESHVLLGIGILAGAALLQELLLTRLISVILWYHFALAVVSLAMLGMGAGGIWLLVRSELFPPERLRKQLAGCALAFAVLTPLGTLVMIGIAPLHSVSAAFLAGLSVQLLAAALPFFCVGLAIGLAFTHRTRTAGSIYAADLIGAGLGCAVVVPLMNALGLGGSVLIIGVLGALSSLCFARGESTARGLKRGAVACIVILSALALVQGVRPWFTVEVTKVGEERAREWEAWNAYSRVTVFPRSDGGGRPAGWGLSPRWEGTGVEEKSMFIDAAAMTPMTRWDGTREGLDRLDYLDWDVTSLGHHLRPAGTCLLVGSGGGRDILTALRFGQQQIRGVEVNPAIHRAMTGRYHDFSGGVYTQPSVEVIVDEARSFLERDQSRYDLLQISMIDTWAATAAGAFVFSEAHLYTVEAFETFHRRLATGGVLAVSRWFNRSQPGETLRLELLAMEAWRRRGVTDPQSCMAIIAHERTGRSVGTLVMKDSPLTAEEMRTLRDLAERMEFSVVWLPDGQTEPSIFADFAMATDPAQLTGTYEFDVSPTLDDQPFFFHMIRFSDVVRMTLGRRAGSSDAFVVAANYRAIQVLVALVAMMSVFAVVFILAPLVLCRREDLAATRGPWRWRLLLYFLCLGLGFMLVEIPLIQRLNLFLGHPIYAFAVVLSTLLVFGGVGSFMIRRVSPESAPAALMWCLPALLALVAVCAFFQPRLLELGLSWTTPARLAAAMIQLIPMGLLMGVALPLGMQIAGLHAPRLIPWLWGVNGVMSVVGSVGALVCGILFGFTVVIVIGGAVYGIAFALVASRPRRESARATPA